MGFIFDVFIVSIFAAVVVNANSIIGGILGIFLISIVIFLLGCAFIILGKEMTRK